jgi:CIC family chloride channel protein
MQPVVTLTPGDALRTAIEVMLANKLREVPVLEEGRIVGFVAEADIGKAYLEATTRLAEAADTTPRG